MTIPSRRLADKSFSSEPPIFDEPFQAQFADLLAWRRDVRRFLTKPIPEPLIEHILDMVQLSPSVGLSQPWRWVRIESSEARKAIRENFATCKAKAHGIYQGDAAKLYGQLKLEGFDKAPLVFAVFCDRETEQGSGLGSHSMPEALDHSVSGMISTFWLYARTFGLGVGWVSVVDPAEVKNTLAVPEEWKLIALLCVGYPEEEHIDPELERCGWEFRSTAGRTILQR